MNSTTRRFRYDPTADDVVEVFDDPPSSSTVGLVQGYSESKPGKSIGMSVHPSQIPEMNELVRAHGIKGVTFDSSKRDNCQITSRKGRRELMKVLGYFDADGGYGDG